MKEAEFKNLDPLADTLNEQCDRWFESPEFAALKESLRAVVASLPQTYSVSIDVELQVFDTKRERGFSLLQTGLNAAHAADPYRTSGDSSVHRYIVDGEICQLPHDRCPHCWDIWDFKLEYPECSRCGYALGQQVRLLLDSDVCPHCERGTISSTQLSCKECGFTLNPTYVTWG